ncbi:unnamed protein product [Medioppia subpectinata]|uniref:Uncharacterized protein n=1 Tax=Medioppia subpectinata TaxID=1979941 RepID=A0A7R9KMK9_9ACAR|nr:unnamed protein product [Medioppia subpectinata]CAG2106383.1 unnamed protein product [Medioppia subpectinata]
MNQEKNEWSEYFNAHQVLAIGLITSHLGLAPKILGCRYFSGSDDRNPRAVALLAQRLARLHSTEMPVPKDKSHEFINNIFGIKWFDERQRQSLREGKTYQEIQKHRYETFETLDLLAEMSWLKNIVVDLKSPIVFSHNDFNRKNILMRETNDENSQQMDIYFIDFDFSTYNHRGIDFGHYFSSWGQNDAQFGLADYPTDDQMLVFIDAYIREMTAINGNSFTQLEINSHQRLIKEAKVFSLVTFIIDTQWCIYQVEYQDQTEAMINSEKRFKCYHNLKKQIQKEYSL